MVVRWITIRWAKVRINQHNRTPIRWPLPLQKKRFNPISEKLEEALLALSKQIESPKDEKNTTLPGVASPKSQVSQGKDRGRTNLGVAKGFPIFAEKLKEALHEPPSSGPNQGKVRVPISFGVSPSKLRLQGIASHEDVITCWKIAKQGDKAAQECLEQMAPNFKRLLGSSLFHGHGVSWNKEEGVIWYWKACKQDDAQARDFLDHVDPQYQRLLGYCLFHGKEVSKDYKEAVVWYHKAVEAGDRVAQRLLGDCLFYGNGVLEDKDAAVVWFRKAVQNGDCEALDFLQHCLGEGYGAPLTKEECAIWGLANKVRERIQSTQAQRTAKNSCGDLASGNSAVVGGYSSWTQQKRRKSRR